MAPQDRFVVAITTIDGTTTKHAYPLPESNIDNIIGTFWEGVGGTGKAIAVRHPEIIYRTDQIVRVAFETSSKEIEEQLGKQVERMGFHTPGGEKE